MRHDAPLPATPALPLNAARAGRVTIANAIGSGAQALADVLNAHGGMMPSNRGGEPLVCHSKRGGRRFRVPTTMRRRSHAVAASQ